MYKFYSNWPGSKAASAGISKIAIIAMVCFATAVTWAAGPANDNFTNATVIAGNGGKVFGSNFNATLEPGEPIDAGVGGGKTIWYVWTAPASETIEFDTEGSDFDTVIGVYTGTNVANLGLIAQNDDLAFPSDLTSQVLFPTVQGQKYYISVDGNEGDSGHIILNWRATGNFSAGQIGFSSGLYIATVNESSTTDIRTPMISTTVIPSHVRVVRTGGTAGKITMGYTVTNTTFTDRLTTNIFGTNIFITNIDSTGNISFTNTFQTNVISIDNLGSGLTFCQFSNAFIITLSNFTGQVGSNKPTITPTNLDFVQCLNTNFTNITFVTNNNLVSTNISITNIFCTIVVTNATVPSATPGVDYQASSGIVTMNDYQLGADIPYTVIPQFAGTTNSPPSLRNHLLLITLTNLTLVPNETTNLVPPTFSASSTIVEILNPETTPTLTNECLVLPAIINFVRGANYLNEPQPGQVDGRVFLQRTGFDFSQGCSVDYTFDDSPSTPFPTPGDWNTFPVEPGSDYATPPNSAPGSRENPHFTMSPGTIHWGAFDGFDKEIDFTVFYDPTVQFNEDFIVQIYNPQSPTYVAIGQESTTLVTIRFNDQPAGAVDRAHNPDNNSGTVPPFNTVPGAGGSQNTVYAVAVQPNNQTVFAGDFRAYNTVPRNRIARMNQDGSLDTTFMASPNNGANDTIDCLALQPDGRVIIGGVFTSFNATNRFHIARLNSDGSLDLNFNPGVGINGTVSALALQSDGKVLVGGNFTFVNATNRNFIARLNTDGSLDTTFNPGVGPNAPVNAIALQTDGKLIIGGQFTTVNNTNNNYIARLNADGTLDTNFNTGLGADQFVYALAEQPDGRVMVGGAFSTINVTPRNGIARLNADGSIDLTFDPGSGADDVVYTIAVQQDGGILAGGLFQSFNSTRRMGITRLNTDGTVDTSFMDTAYNQFAGLINDLHNLLVEPKNFLRAIALQSDGNVIIGGRFSTVGGGSTRDDFHTRMNVARLIGGATPGPGNIGLAYPGYTVDKPDNFTQQNTLFVTLIRTNGFVGPASVTLQPNPLHQGAGNAVPGTDFLQTVDKVTYPSSYANTWMVSDGEVGANSQPVDVLGGNHGQIGPFVTVLNDAASSGNLGLNLQLTLPVPAGSLFLSGEPISTGVALGRSAAPMTIVDDTVPAGTLAFSVPQFFVSESATNAVISVIRTNGSIGPVSVQYLTVPGTAQPGATNDYTAVNGTLSFDSGETNKTFLVPIIDNFVVRPDRFLTLTLTNPAGGAVLGANSNATLTIINDNFLPGRLSFSDTNYTANQNDGWATISVIRRGGSQGTETITYSTSDGSATNGLDYLATNGLLTWNSGDVAPKTFMIRLLNSGLVNSNTTINLQLSNPLVNGVANTNGYQPPINATLTIINDNFFGMPTLSASNYFVNENSGGVVITVNRLGGSSQTITVDFATSDGTAVGFSDYIPTSGTLTFTNGQISESFFVPVINNPTQVSNFLSFNVTLSNPTPSSGPGGGVSLGNPSTAGVTIIANQITDQPPGSPDTTFSSDAGFNGTVYALALQSNGYLIASGDFTEANNIARNRIARLNSSGLLDVKFSSATGGANGSVRALAIQSDGQILAGGLFTTFNGVNNNYIARLNFDGTLDSTFNSGIGPDNPVFAISETFVGGTAAANRKLVIGGSFASVGGVPYRSIAQLNQDGSVDSTFKASGANGTVFAVAVYSTNDSVNASKILIGGDFTTVNGTNVNHIARLNADGSLDTTFNSILFNSGPDNTVRSIAIQVDGKIVIGGTFDSVNGMPLNRIARLNPDGKVDTSFAVGVGANDAVTVVTLQQDLKVVTGGNFTRASGVTRNRLTRLNLDGTVDTGINFGLGANDFVDTIVIQPDGKLVIGGGFTQYDGQTKQHIARIFGGTITGSGEVQFTAGAYQVSEKATNAVITVRRVDGTDGTANVIVSSTDNTAISGIDYTGVTNLISFPPGETFQTVTIPVINDPTNSGVLSAFLALTQPQGDPNAATLGNQSTAELDIVGANSTVSFSSASYAVNKNVSSGSVVISVQRNNSSIGAASVDFFTTLTGTATPFQDYTPVTNTVFFADGETNEFVTIPIINNGLPEGNVTVGLALANPTNTVLDTSLPTTATLTIVDNSLSPGRLGFSAPSYSVAQTGTNAVITIIRTNGSVGQVSVNFAVNGGTATPGLDYIPTNGAITFLDGQLSKSFLVPILNNTNLTSDVTVNLTLSSPSGGATITGPTTVSLTILNQNLDVGFAQAGYFVDEKSGNLVIGVNRFGNTNRTVKVNYSTADATAHAGTNYGTASGTLTFNSGQTFQTFIVPILDDPAITGDLLFFVNLTTNNTDTNVPPVQIVAPTATVTVLDDDSGFQFASATNSIIKGATNAVISVLRLGSTAGAASVSFNTSGGTAVANSEYTPTNGVLNFISGQTSNSFVVQILNDNQIDGDRTVNLSLSNATAGAAVLSPSNSVLTIIDTESGVSFSSGGYSVQENGVAATITVVRTGVTNGPISVNYTTADGTGHAGSQYVAASGTLTFTNGQTSASFQVPIIDNNITGGSSTVNLLLSNPSGNTTLVSPSAAVLTILNNDGSDIIPAGSLVLVPANGAISPGSSVTVLLSLRNSAGDTATNVTATLLNTNGVTPTGTTTQNYGNLAVNGPSAFRQFTFNASGTNGGTLSAMLQLQYTSNKGTNSSVVTFAYILGTSTNIFSNTNLITINDKAPATPYPSSINISSLVGVINKVTATVSNIGHAYISDVSMLLVGPAGQKELLMEQTGGAHTITNVTLTFDSASGNLLTTNAPVTGTYAPSPLQTTNLFPNATNGTPPPPQPYNSNLSDFNGSNPNGTWQLWVADIKALDTGTINNGWSLAFTTLNVVSPNEDLVVGLSANPSIVIVNSNLTYTIAVTNAGPSSATGVVVSNALPAGTTLISVVPSQGTYTTNGGVVTCSLGGLAANGTASIAITVKSPNPGTLTNSVSVAANEIEDNPLNNSASLVTPVVTASADLAIGANVAPNIVLFGNNATYTVSVTNLGPGTATGVVVTNTLPPGVSLKSSTTPFGLTNSAGTLTVGLGSLGSGAVQNFTLVVSATNSGTFSTTFGVTSDVPDPLKGNNSATAKAVVQFVPLGISVVGNSLTFSWDGSASSYHLQATTTLAPPNWTDVNATITQVNGQNTVTLPISSGTKFFRLISP